MRSSPLVPFIACQLAFAQGNYAKAAQLIDERLECLQKYGLHAFVPELLLLQGETLLAMDQTRIGHEALQDATAAARHLGSKRILWQALARLSLLEAQTTAAQQRQEAVDITTCISNQIDDPLLQQSFAALVTKQIAPPA